MKYIKLFLIASSIVAACASAADVSDPNAFARTPGTHVGVIGGIPTRTTVVTITADNTGATDASAAIQSAVNSASAGTVLYLPAGSYRVNTSISINRSDITLRGAGRDTIILPYGDAGFLNGGSSSDYAWALPEYAYPANTADNKVTAGLTAGSTTITIGNTSAFANGDPIQIAIENQDDNTEIAAGKIPIISVFGYPTLRRPMHRVVSVLSGTQLEIQPPIRWTVDSNLDAWVNLQQTYQSGIGIEDITVDATNSTAGFQIVFTQIVNSWFKNVKVTKARNYPFALMDSMFCEISKCWFAERTMGGSNGAGILLNHSASNLIYDNVLVDISPPMEINFGSTGNVIAYNFLYNAVGGVLNVNHGPHNSHNYFEGNLTSSIQSDGFFGGSSQDTFYRNWITAWWYRNEGNATAQSSFAISLNRFTRNYAFIGNLIGWDGWVYTDPYSFGNPNMGNSYFDGTAEPSTGDFWLNWKDTGTLTTRTNDTSGQITITGDGVLVPGSTPSVGNPHGLQFRTTTGASIASVEAYAQSGKVITFYQSTSTLPAEGTVMQVWWRNQGYQESDLDVGNTTLLKANYHAWTSASEIPAGQALGGDTLADSLYLSEKPDWFGSLSWPPFDPTNPPATYDTDALSAIPAAWRYIKGNEDYLGGVAIPTFTPSAGTHPAGTTLTMSTSTSGASIYYTIDGSTPSASTTLYSGPVSLSVGTTVVKAIGIKTGLDDSAIRTGTYILVNVPSAASNVNATAVSSSQINITWSDNSDNESGFRVERRVGVDAWASVATTAANTTSYSNTGLAASTTYEYRIFAVNAAGDSTSSNTDTATTQSEGGTPSANINVNGNLIIQRLILQ